MALFDPHSHQPVLEEQILALLDPQPGEVAVDCTMGRGGHAVRLAEAIRSDPESPTGRNGRLIAFDLDPDNLAYGMGRVEAAGVPVDGFHENFARAPRRVAELGLRADLVLADLGFSSSQMDDPARGLSFRHEGPLDMRYDRGAEASGRVPGAPSAARLIATLPEAELANLIVRYGEEPLGRRIARKLVEVRGDRPIETTAELADLVCEAYGGRARASRNHPATRTFMALRIAVNGELDALGTLLDGITRGAENAARMGRTDEPDRPGEPERHERHGWLRPGARVAMISFHSLEDRLVKRAFADLDRRGLATRLTRRPVTASEAELISNPRSRSAKLRAVRLEPVAS